MREHERMAASAGNAGTAESNGSRVILIMGSPTDRPFADLILTALAHFDLAAETYVASAHKTPEYLLGLLRRLEETGRRQVYITVAGRSNALSGFVDAQVTAPVIACPPPSDAFAGLDVLSSLRMPRGVAPLTVLEPENAALAAAKILAFGVAALEGAIGAAQERERQRVLEYNEPA
jgi:phosphoribosylaminoimidazole carboxylase PurE protein